jgi:Bacterial regulatory proteins, luxR family
LDWEKRGDPSDFPVHFPVLKRLEAKDFERPKTVALNEREVEVLTWVARGKTSAEIAQILGLTKRTVRFSYRQCARQTRRGHAHRSGDQSSEWETDRAVIPASSGLPQRAVLRRRPRHNLRRRRC